MIIRKAKTREFTQVDNVPLLDARLSWKAKGILVHILSRPDEWQFYESEMCNHAKDGRDALRSGIKELEDAGYLVRTRVRSEKGYLKEYEYVVHETPQNGTTALLIQMGKSNVGKSNVGKSDTSNTDLNKTDFKNKKACNRETLSGDVPMSSASVSPLQSPALQDEGQNRSKVTTIQAVPLNDMDPGELLKARKHLGGFVKRAEGHSSLTAAGIPYTVQTYLFPAIIEVINRGDWKEYCYDVVDELKGANHLVVALERALRRHGLRVGKPYYNAWKRRVQDHEKEAREATALT